MRQIDSAEKIKSFLDINDVLNETSVCLQCQYDDTFVNLHLPLFICRDCLGDSSLAGDLRWAGTYGVNLDFVARSHCSVEFISIEAMQVHTSVQ